jgi:hypothetical protein
VIAVPAVWLVLACFGPDPNSIATARGSYSPAECDLQSYALPITLGRAAHVAVCYSVTRPDFKSCNRRATMVRVQDLGAGEWLPGQFYEPSRAVGHWDVVPSRSIAWGVAGPAARSWVSLDAGAFFTGFWTFPALLSVALGVWLVLRQFRRGRKAAPGQLVVEHSGE